MDHLIKPAEEFEEGLPGVYRDVEFDAYAGSDAINASLLKAFILSPAHALDAMSRPDEPKRHFQFGQASHTWLLEPDKFASHVCVTEQCAASKKDGSRCSNAGLQRHEGQWYCGVRGHLPGPADTVTQSVVTADEYDSMKLAAESLCSHHGAMQLLTSEGDNELTVLARHEPTGLLLKSRLDLYRPQFSTISDLKTCRSASPKLFSSDMAKLGYDLQAAFYFNVARMAGLPVDHFTFLAVEKQRPFLAGTYRVVDHLIDAAWKKCELLLDRLAGCMESGEWPGYGDTFVDIDVPSWRYDILWEVEDE